MTFHHYAKQKFNNGRSEHGQPWDKEHIDHTYEIQQELLDIYNYASLDPLDGEMFKLMQFAKVMWEKLEARRTSHLTTKEKERIWQDIHTHMGDYDSSSGMMEA